MYHVCVFAVGELTSPAKGPYAEPLYFDKPPNTLPFHNSSNDYEDEEEDEESVAKMITAERKMNELNNNSGQKEADSKQGSAFCPQALISEPNHRKNNKISTELRKLEQGEVSLSPLLVHFFLTMLKLCLLFSFVLADFYLSSLSQLHPAEMQEQLLSCLSSDPYSNWEPWDKKVTHNSQHLV